MPCPYCGSRYVLCDITIRWSHFRGQLRSERGHFCTGCGRSFPRSVAHDLAFSSVQVAEVSPALYSLQRSGDVVIVRHRSGASEVLF
jgi:hypothetical protein